MYGKSFESMYEGSMIGAGINVFAVWNYIITKGRKGFVEINPKLLAFTLGGTEADVVSALTTYNSQIPTAGQGSVRVVGWSRMVSSSIGL